MSTPPYKNVPGLTVADYVCRNDGRACALLSGNVLVFELDAELVAGGALGALSRYLRAAGMTVGYVIAWGYDAQGNYKPGYKGVIQLAVTAGAQTEIFDIPQPINAAAGDTWYFAVHMAPFNKPLLKVFLETL